MGVTYLGLNFFKVSGLTCLFITAIFLLIFKWMKANIEVGFFKNLIDSNKEY